MREPGSDRLAPVVEPADAGWPLVLTGRWREQAGRLEFTDDDGGFLPMYDGHGAVDYSGPCLGIAFQRRAGLQDGSGAMLPP